MKIIDENLNLDKIFFCWLRQSECTALRFKKSQEGFIAGDVDILINENPQDVIDKIALALPDGYAVTSFCKLGTFGAIIYNKNFPSILRIDFHKALSWRNLTLFEGNDFDCASFVNLDQVRQINPQINLFYKFVFCFLNKDMVGAFSYRQKLHNQNFFSRRFPLIFEIYDLLKMLSFLQIISNTVISCYIIFLNIYQFIFWSRSYCKNTISFLGFLIFRAHNTVVVSADNLPDRTTEHLVERFYLRGLPINWNDKPQKFHLNITHCQGQLGKNRLNIAKADEFSKTILRKLL